MGRLVEGRAVLDAFRGKRVLITGDTGFKGSWLATWLHAAGADVYGAALPALHGEDSLFHRLNLQKKIKHTDCDITNPEQLAQVFRAARPEVVLHLAAQAIVRLSYDDPRGTYQTNVMGSVNVLEEVRRSDTVAAFIYVTSDKCYLNKEWLWGYRECDELGGHDPYSASKAAAEIVFASYADSFLQKKSGLGYATVRAGNVIGGGDAAPSRIVPDCVRAIREGQPVVLRNPKATRPWQHVLDPLFGYLKLAANLFGEHRTKLSSSFNFGPDPSSIYQVLDVAELIVDTWGRGSVECRPDPNAVPEAGLLHLNCDKARHLLNWRPTWIFERAVRETAVWYRDVVDAPSAERVTMAQIEAFMGAVHD